MFIDAGYVELLVVEERVLRQVDLVPMLGSKSYVSQVLSGHRPISKSAASWRSFLRSARTALSSSAKVCVQRRLVSAPRTAAAEV
jgi:hypothetical protein